MALVINELKQGRRVICPCFRKDVAEKLYKHAKSVFGDSKNILLHTSDNRWNGEDVNVLWKEADLVIHTSTIDCGLSFEIQGHFHMCVCFYDNCAGPTYETGVQMLSRCRDVRNFIVCLRITTMKLRDDSPDGVLAFYQDTKQILPVELAFFGVSMSLEDNGSGKWATCHAYIGAYAMKEVVRRRTSNDIGHWLIHLLRQDGAIIENLTFDVSLNSLPAVDCEIQVPFCEKQKVAKIEQLESVYGILNPDDKDVLEKLSRPATVSAFKNLGMLARNGIDFPNALNNIRSNLFNATIGFEFCRQTGMFDPNVHARAEVLAGVTGGCYDLRANETARDFIQAVLGFSDPFNLPVQTDIEISARLGCTLVILGEKEVLSVCRENAKQLLSLLDAWILCRPEMHTPWRIPAEDELTFIKTMHLVNHVLCIMFDLQYERQGKPIQKTRNKIRTLTYTYALQESLLFTRFKPDLSHERKKPVIPAWSTGYVADLPSSELLAVKGDMVQPAAAFMSLKSDQCRLRPMDGIKKVDVGLMQPSDGSDWVPTITEVIQKKPRKKAKPKCVKPCLPSDAWGQDYKDDVLSRERAKAPWVASARVSVQEPVFRQTALGFEPGDLQFVSRGKRKLGQTNHAEHDSMYFVLKRPRK
jgi:hypothetical protein